MSETLGHYRILERIGVGGIGEVYRARDTRAGRTVAIKVLSADLTADAERRERLLEEARAVTAVSHQNIATLFEVAEEDGQPFLVFEYVPGQPLTRVIGGRPLNPRRAVDLAGQIADALAEAHAADVVHRDLRPDTIIITPKGNAKILDFGLAQWTAAGAARQAASAAMAGGASLPISRVAYLSPEQASGQEGDHRTDIYSLGVILYEMLTGKLPFPGATLNRNAIVSPRSMSRPSSVNAAVPPELDSIVAKAMLRSLDERYEVAATLSAELRSIAAVLDIRAAAADPAKAAVRRRQTSHGGRVVWLAVLIAALLAAVWWIGVR
jgi:serine/threonine protein kinase